ncbi:MAG: DUF5009 domain-containing protein [Okeania sp. SIO2G4]|uniref:DUF5009 domain-containing protein n=1 Tax=unclassified Okeania TaxID=2634635 RepID=UPI0013BE459F|nr:MULTISPECIES: DUF5009 domain-containing protein [unclassified Okeania]NEP39934.1 DUF5009 domain-containing protein [Okeania sp. SIO2H7]NEP75101.1 DUF5009 domain-containing protein [Okeania sp. SIO2G5]NEP93177.1 DUF5009 domain-containing protein [Okeania sp. SIO2F5]NEQ90583.1 DUF5009 domain-containing protein [Okeania sp. SIO2G4]
MVKQLTSKKRAEALDALRGFAILMMVLSGIIPRDGTLPTWMYHAQTPPPNYVFNPNIPGLTWVDIVFPIFLFAMGASIPLALSRLINKGWRYISIFLFILKRGFFLGTFAIVFQHFRPHIINNAEEIPEKWKLALLGFLILFLMYSRLPKFIPKLINQLITVVGWFLCVLVLSRLVYPDGSNFSLERSDIILIVLTNMAVFGSIIWLFTQSNWWLRLGLLGILLGLRFSAADDGWVKDFWFNSPLPWIFRFDYLKYLFIVIPGTISGDLILKWMRNNESSNPDSTLEKWPASRFFIIAVLMLTIDLVLLIGLQSRLVLETTLISGVLCASGWLLFQQPSNQIENLLNKLYGWGIYWLVLGLAFEPFQGGIKKDSATLSYFFITTGMSIFLLILFTVVRDYFQQKSILKLFIYNGQNPMIAYVVFGNLLLPILKLTGWYEKIAQMTQTTRLGLLTGFIYTLIVALIVSIFSKLKLFWRT